MNTEIKKTPLFTWVWLAVLLLAAGYLRLHNTDYFYYNPDEAMHTNIARGNDLSEVWRFAHYEIHPPLLYFASHYWMKLSDSVAFMHLLPLTLGLMLLVLCWRIGTKLGGEYGGIACASLAAFSHGLIIQSAVMRQYVFLLFFLSLGFYCYLHWRESRRGATLLAYTLCGMLAALSHFSAVLCVACFTLLGFYELLRAKAAPRYWALWALANLAILFVAVALYHSWKPILTPLASYFTEFKRTPQQMIRNALLYPQAVADYIFPRTYMSYGLLPLVLLYAILPHRNVLLRRLALLTLVGSLAGMVLYYKQIYPPLGTRRSLWLAPLLLPAAALAFADVCERILRLLLPSFATLRSQIFALALLAAGMATYGENQRFQDGSEYAMPLEQWTALNASLEKLGPDDLIVTEKDDGIMLANLYRVMGENAFTGAHMAALAPYRNLHILFNLYYPRNYSRNVLAATLHEAHARGMLDGVKRLVFLRLAWSRSPLTDLMLCNNLGKEIRTFPPLDGKKLTRKTIENSFAAFMIVPKTSLDNMLANGCMDGGHDMVPGFTPIRR